MRERSLQLLREDEGRGYRDVVAILVDEARGGKSTDDVVKSGEARNGGREVVDVKVPEQAVNGGARIVSDALDGIVQFEGEPR